MKFTEFLKRTNGFNGVDFNGGHSISLDILQDCYDRYLQTGINYAEVIHEISMLSMGSSFDDGMIIYKDDEYNKLMAYLNDEYIKTVFHPSHLQYLKGIVDHGYSIYLRMKSYDGERRKANSFLANKKNRKKIFKELGRKCVNCGATDNLSIDHIVSIYNGGTNDIGNLQILCVSCNSSKGTLNTKY